MEKKLLDKLNKLLALSKSPNINEGNLALEMAEKLMNENGISYSDLDKENIADTLGAIGQEEVRNTTTAVEAWEKLLGQLIAKHFDCLYFTSVTKCGWYRSGSRKTYYAPLFIGHEANRRTAIIMFNWISKLIKKEARKRYSRWSLQTSYSLGAVEQLSQKYKKETVEESNEKGLMVVDEVEKWVSDNLKVKTKSLSIRGDSESYNSGKALGDTLSLNKQFNLKAISA